MGSKPAQPPFALTVSAEARAVMTPLLDASPPEAMFELLRNAVTRKIVRAGAANHLKPLNKARAERFEVAITKGKMGGVPVRLVQKKGTGADNRLLINFHGGGFMVDSGSLTETIPIAGLSGIKVAAVMYRMAPENPYPAAVDDALAVYREALSQRSPGSIGIFGSSAGAILTLQLLARIKSEKLPMPAAAGFFSGAGDLSQPGDCEAFLPAITGERSSPDVIEPYCGGMDRTDPLLSPVFGDLSGLPPMLLMTSTRDQLLSHTVLTDAALRRASVDVDLRVYEGMAHAFWAWIECPETDMALTAQAEFFSQHLRA